MHFPSTGSSTPRTTAVILGLVVVGWISQSARGETLPLDSKHSEVSFSCHATLHSFRGEAKDMAGGAEFDRTLVPPIQKATLQFDTASLTTFHAERDRNMYAWLGVKVHPKAVFRLESVKLLSGDYKSATSEHPAKFGVSGTFTLNGITKPLSGTATGWREQDRVVISGQTTVDTSKFGLPQIVQAALLRVDTEVSVTYRFAFILPASLPQP